jgi:hypothetical protein
MTKSARSFWWLFELDDHDDPVSDLQWDLAGRTEKVAPVTHYSRKSRFQGNLESSR